MRKSKDPEAQIAVALRTSGARSPGGWHDRAGLLDGALQRQDQTMA